MNSVDEIARELEPIVKQLKDKIRELVEKRRDMSPHQARIAITAIAIHMLMAGEMDLASAIATLELVKFEVVRSIQAMLEERSRPRIVYVPMFAS